MPLTDVYGGSDGGSDVNSDFDVDVDVDVDAEDDKGIGFVLLEEFEFVVVHFD